MCAGGWSRDVPVEFEQPNENTTLNAIAAGRLSLLCIL